MHLTGNEYKIMLALINNNGYAEKEDLLRAAYPNEADRPETKIIDAYISKMNLKLRAGGHGKHWIKDHGEFVIYSGDMKRRDDHEYTDGL